ncbi:protein kinase domain containing protein [Stylonychia lemnae]|uniref:non-specific serine/threonine protein kinase n=1 Tax=Stylonychia lemnae TaxID=5949 RepID=A0A077ZXS7_STYLE|nr:protein kinase domain containing protein [Stylonychia lemnae]|eukprot:CDW74042.1 protein kinase domain containing protein [Stylonychia lemnae]
MNLVDNEFLNRLEFQQYYADGGQSKIFLVQDKLTNTKYVVKQAMVHQNEKFQENLIHEAAIYAKCGQIKGVLKFVNFVQFQTIDQLKIQTSLIIEHAQYGSLQSIQQFTIPFLEGSAFVIINQVSQTLLQLHQRQIAHLDIKEGNIMIGFDKLNQQNRLCGGLPIIFKVGDFGISRDMSVEDLKKMKFNQGTPKLMAPEQFIAKEGQIKNPYKLDVFQLGIVLFHLVFKEYPFIPNAYEDKNSRDPNFVQKFLTDKRNKHSKKISPELVDLLSQMLQFQPDKRINMTDVIGSSWFKMQENILQFDNAAYMAVRNQLFQKMTYITNITKVKIPLVSNQKQSQASISQISENNINIRNMGPQISTKQDSQVKNSNQNSRQSDQISNSINNTPQIQSKFENNDQFSMDFISNYDYTDKNTEFIELSRKFQNQDQQSYNFDEFPNMDNLSDSTDGQADDSPMEVQ